mmetsp:Transcript_120182/g.218513  ORF Transcript_120182/g.218513 Transcript_120182/m.218513 type:complete len:382 (-) Transcript_120182:289-1434(-)
MVSESVKSVALLTANVACTIGIVVVNKLVLMSFPYSMTLTWCHQVVAGIVIMGRKCRFQPEKPLPFWTDVWFSFIAIAAIYTQNLSLRINTVTLYQVSKLLNIPAQCLLQYFTKNKVFSLWVYGSLVVLTLGVALSTVAELDFEATIAGIVAALLGVVSVVTEQAEIGRLKEKYQVTSMDFLHSNSMHRMIMSGCLILLVERKALSDFPQMSFNTAFFLFLSCLIATGINITVVAVIGQFGAVTTAVIGHLKTIIIISLGFMLHPPRVDWVLAKNLTGIAIALFGAIKYGQYTSFPEVDWCRSCQAEAGELSSKDELGAVKEANCKAASARVIPKAIAVCVLMLCLTLPAMRSVDASLSLSGLTTALKQRLSASATADGAV